MWLSSSCFSSVSHSFPFECGHSPSSCISDKVRVMQLPAPKVEILFAKWIVAGRKEDPCFIIHCGAKKTMKTSIIDGAIIGISHSLTCKWVEGDSGHFDCFPWCEPQMGNSFLHPLSHEREIFPCNKRTT